jgi:hypothetical protein
MWRAGKLIIGNPVGFFRNIDTRMLPLAPIGATGSSYFLLRCLAGRGLGTRTRNLLERSA